MILRRLVLMLATAAALATSGGVAVVALAFCLHALIEPYLGMAGATAVVVGAAAALIGAAALVMFMMSRSRRKMERAPVVATSPVVAVTDRALDFVRQRPVVAISAALGVGFLAIRNPRYLGAAISAFVGSRPVSR